MRSDRLRQHSSASDDDAQLRQAAFDRVSLLDQRFAGAIPWNGIESGFVFGGETVFLSTRAKGIFRPRQMRRGVLSVKTVMPRTGREQRYRDLETDEGYFEYSFRGNDPAAPDNIALLEAAQDQTPLIYFRAIATSIYQAVWPVYVGQWLPRELCVQLIPGVMHEGLILPIINEDTRRYSVIETKRRLHQAMFRELILTAYDGCCALTNIPERTLVHAAHILPDRDKRGLPRVENGIAMSALHHAAYDVGVLGIDPEGIIHIRGDVREIRGVPVVEHALQRLHGARMRFPKVESFSPNRDFLAERFEQFRKEPRIA